MNRLEFVINNNEDDQYLYFEFGRYTEDNPCPCLFEENGELGTNYYSGGLHDKEAKILNRINKI